MHLFEEILHLIQEGEENAKKEEEIDFDFVHKMLHFSASIYQKCMKNGRMIDKA